MQFSFRRSNVIIRRERKIPRRPDTSIPAFSTPWSSSRGRVGPFFLSLSLHVVLAGSVFLENYLRPPLELQPVTVDQLLADERYELTWPVLPADLPPVQPAEPPKPQAAAPPGGGEPPRFRLPQQVVANEPASASSRQMIWDQAPQVELNRDVPSPNFVEPPRPDIQRPRFELAEGQLQAPARQAVAAEKAPAVATTAQAVPEPVARDPRLRYWTPETDPSAPQRRALLAEAAPDVAAGPAGGLDIEQIQPRARLRYWTPEQQAAEPGRQVLTEKAPQIVAAPAAGVDLDPFQRLSRLRYQQADDGAAPAAPQRRAVGAAGSAPDLPGSALGSASQAGARDVVLEQTLASLGSVGPAAAGRAVVGVDPTQDAPGAVPRGQRGGNFTAGPDGVETPAAGNGSGEGEGADGGNLTAAVRVPHLSVTPASPGAAPGLSDTRPPDPGARDANVDRETLLSQFRTASLSPIPNIGVVAAEDLPDPEAPFPGRAVYTLAVNMPNINSYSGSWIIEFAEAKNAEILAGQLQPPSPRLKVDPVYPRDAIDERIEGDVVLHAMIRSDGLVDHIQVLKRLDGRLDRSAQTALAKWRFNPATKNGVPVDIETVVRIPFRLTPRENTRP